MSKENAVILCGAASLIAQEVALIDVLMKGYGLSFSQQDTLLAGLSSGALNVIAINAAFSGDKPIPWDIYKNDYLFNLKTKNIYIKNGSQYDTSPLRKYIEKFITKAGYQRFGKLPFSSATLVAWPTLPGRTYWINNVVPDVIPEGNEVAAQIREEWENLDSVDVLMSTTAVNFFGVAIFPTQNIRYDDGNNEKYIIRNGEPAIFSDGGTWGSFLRFDKFFNAFLNKEGQIKKNMYIIAPDLRLVPETPAEDFQGLDENTKEAITQRFSLQNFITFLKKLKEFNDQYDLVKGKIYVSKPNLKYFDPLNFNFEKTQYDDTKTWAKNNPTEVAIPIDQYIKKHI